MPRLWPGVLEGDSLGADEKTGRRCPVEDHRQPFQAGRVQRFPKLSFAGGAFAGGHQGDFVARLEALLGRRFAIPPPGRPSSRKKEEAAKE